MPLPVKRSDIKEEILAAPFDYSKKAERPMLLGEIPGASVYHHILPAGETLIFSGQTAYIRILFLCDGSMTFSSDGKSFSYEEKAMFTAKPQSEITVHADADCSFLEIRWDMNESDLLDLEHTTVSFPISEAYQDAEQYRDFFKSQTTISRSILKQGVIPRFAMGSVEANGDDLVGQHAHPLLDQFFFSFPENDMDLLIDCHIYPMKGNTLLHIPLGSNHGVIARGSQKMHYLWIDCTPQEQKDEAVAYLDEVHKPTGIKQVL